ncbi:MAG TPA: DNA mismatch repair protein MutS [Pyrinomonadaceae bacterium]|jgi:DNA mismatch repair protein MutS|nr:DNA mismatch repair protein MutS [Pyrinomonadaceae bacterium]
MTTTNQNATPMLRQYQELKRQHPGTLLFFRLGDFYELFFEDAVTGARELEITLTARQKERGQPVPMCGVPHTAVAAHVARLIRKGYRVAICEQTEDPSKARKLVRREVVRVITPGTAFDPNLVEAKETVFLAALCGAGDTFGAAFLDLSTGEFRATEVCGPEAWARVRADIESYAPRELLFPASLAPLVRDAYTGRSAHTTPLPLSDETQGEHAPVAHITPAEHAASPNVGIALTPLDEWLWEPTSCASLLLEQFGARTLEGYGLGGKVAAVCAAGASLRYARETQRAAAAHITDITFFETHDHLVLDAVTCRNLELFESQGPSARGASLLATLDATTTGMGARLLRSWMQRPSLRRVEIESRLAAVEDLHRSQILRDRLRVLLREVSDLERLTGRINMGTATPRDLCALRRSLNQVPPIRQALSDAGASLLQVIVENADELADVRELIARSISDDPPVNFSEGGVVRAGFDPELEELRSVSRDAKQTIATLEARERARSGIQSLRVRFNNVFGYFIEVSKASAARVPSDYERRQTLANAERYTTLELKEWEQKVLGAEGRILEIETRIFGEVRAQVAEETRRLQATARALSILDALASLAEVAARRRYRRPVLHDGDEMEIKGGRHPVIEAIGEAQFIPNDLYLNNSTDRLLIITGPNMGGKSTLLRQTALIALLAQMGSFVPAERARLPVFDRIWTRVGASDDLSHGRSTFMVEMTETAAILHNATPRSLVLLDEIGRGTATFDGLSIAWAVAEHLHDSPEHAAKTLFATHYHELTELAERLPGAQNYRIRVAEREGEVIFLYKIERGRASKSYGIEVARLAGLPPSVLSRAREVLSRLERYELDVFDEEADGGKKARASAARPDETGKEAGKDGSDGSDSGEAGGSDALRRAASRAGRRALASRLTLFDSVNQSILDELRGLDVETLSEEEARQLIRELKNRIV